MSVEYDQYLAEHIGNVHKGLQWMNDNLPLSKEEKEAIWEAMFMHTHDASKYDKDEYDAYDAYFYGGNISHKVNQDFNNAWLRHIHKNPHHWQYWVLLEDDPETGLPEKPLMMPLDYIFEMIADWWTFSWRSNNLFEMFAWYAEHRDKQIMHPQTRAIVERILKKIWDVLIMQAALEGKDTMDIEQQYMKFWMGQEMLAHSGVKGQKWGVQNGPPYPLNAKKVAEEIFEDAQYKSAKITNDVVESAKHAGGNMHGLENQLKTKESIERKLNKKVNEKGMSLTDAANSIKDAARYTVISSPDNFVRTYNNFKSEMAKKGYTETSCDNYFDKFNKGEVKHKAVQSNFADKDGYEFEVQFHTPESQNAKDKKIPLYNERRSSGISESRAKELEKQMEDLAIGITDPKNIEDILSHSDSEDSDDENKYGVPEQKKFPMPDKDHVKSAIRFFNYVDPKYEQELADAILERAKEYGLKFGEDITVGDDNKFKKYLPKEES